MDDADAALARDADARRDSVTVSMQRKRADVEGEVAGELRGGVHVGGRMEDLPGGAGRRRM